MTVPLVTTAARQARAPQEDAHRPWPAPAWPWSVAETIVESASCHWPADPAARRLYGLPAARARVAVKRERGSAGALRVEASRTRPDGAPARAEVGLQTVARPGLAAGPPALAHLAAPLDQLVWAPERRSE